MSGPAVNEWPVSGAIITLESGRRFDHLLPGRGDGDTRTTVMVYSGEPIREPVAFGGNFVMSTQAEIAEAYRDFRSGKFGGIPRQARLKYR